MKHNLEHKSPVEAKPRLLRGTLMMLFRAMVGAYGLSVLGFLVLRLIMGESLLILAFFNTFAHLLWLPALLLLPLCLLLRAWIPALLLLPTLAAFMLNYGPQFLPRDADTSAEPSLSLLSYNLLARRVDYSASIAIIREANADIVALQEVDVDAVAQIEAQLGDLYPYMALHPQPRATAGQGILSRYPIEEDIYWQYNWLPIPLGYQRVRLNIMDKPLILYNVHPTNPAMGDSYFDPRNREREIADLLLRLAEETAPLIIAGDFNLTDQNEDYNKLSAQYQDVYRAVGWGMGWTFPDWAGLSPFLRIDYVFISETLAPQAAQVLDSSGGSDHYPLWVRLSLP